MKRSLSVVVIVLILVAAALVLFSDWFKYTFTGNVVESGFTCGKYGFISPTDVTVSSSADGKSAANAIDGTTITTWQSNKDAASWINFDLGTKRCVNGINLFVNKEYVPLIVNVYVSNDASSWKIIKQGYNIATGNRYLKLYFPAESARYVRLFFNTGQRAATSSGTGPKTFYGSISEIRVNAAQLIPAVGSGAGSGSGEAPTRDVTNQPPQTDQLNRQLQQGGEGGRGQQTESGESGGRKVEQKPVVNEKKEEVKQEEENVPEFVGEGEVERPKGSNILWWLLLLLAAGLILFFIFYKKKKKNEDKASEVVKKVAVR